MSRRGTRRAGERPGGLPWGPRTDTLGLCIVDEVGQSFTLDEEWSLQTEHGFEWWGEDLAQRVWSEPGLEDDGYEVFRVHAQTDLLRDFDPTGERLRQLNAFAQLSSTSGYLVDEAAGTVRLAASMVVHEDITRWASPTFKLVCAIQAADAHILAAPLAEATGAAVAASAHPVSGPRPRPDDMLGVVDDVVAPLGERPSAWEGEEMAWTTSFVQGSARSVLALGDETGLSAEFPFQSRTSLLTVSTGERNPRLGHGVLLALHLPMRFAEEDGLRFAAELTRRELSARTRTHHLGAWCWRDGLVHFVSFLPNIAHVGRGDLFNLVMSMGLRARWVAETFYGDDWEANVDADGRPLARPSALALDWLLED